MATRTYAGQAVPDRRVQRRQQFLDAGVEVFGTSGYASSSITVVCKSAGLARAQYYEHFSNREELLLAVYDMIQTDARDAVASALREHADAPAATRVAVAVTAYARSLGSDPRRAAISFVEIIGVSPHVEQHRIDQRTVWAEFFETELRRLVGPDFQPPGGYPAAATGFIGALIALVHQWSTTDPRPPLNDVTEVLTRFLLGLIS
ncbi:TetR/AcrR family transcriptional regulator [Nocardia jejuensis]|uniref:TetR/AcrR family transcriptional regulator n=1 Tax=Nocardia jejuensis TaxID=328049 RepID=UPI00083007C6|nr:TetR/AcrR family transcriptional regulator [Nocardia jejuensis]